MINVNAPESIRILMPTRGRPQQAKEAIASVLGNASGSIPIEVILCVDDDDPDSFSINLGSQVSRLTGTRKSFAQWVNEAWKCPGEFTWLTWLDDDARYLTKRWDLLVVKHKEVVVYGPDGFQNKAKATHPFFRPAIPRAIGYIVHPSLSHYRSDVFIQKIGQELNSIAYDPEIQIEHLHPAAGKAKNDLLYQHNMDAYWNKDQKVWKEIVDPSIPSSVNAIRCWILVNGLC